MQRLRVGCYTRVVPDPPPERSSRVMKILASLVAPYRLVLGLVGATAIGALVVLGPKLLFPPPDHVITERPTPALLMALREVSRLETAEVHVEKVVDLTDRQSSLFGLVEAKDALLLVAVGRAIVGVDLGKMRPEDVTFDAKTGKARLDLPEPEVLSAMLDEDGTYVFSRSTDLMARRNEQLEAAARRQAQRAIEAAARTPDVMKRARAQAERQLSALARALGAKEVEIRFHASSNLTPKGE